MPKILLPHRLLGNIYVRELGRAYVDLGCETVFGPENLFESNWRPDIVHLNWPEDLYRGYGSGSPSARAEALFDKLDELVGGGARIAWTVHNEKPHESSDRNLDATVYQRVINSSDVIHHHCECSREKLGARYKIPASITEFVAPHGHYFSYRNDISKEEAREKLSISGDAFVYLHFGAIRGYKGIDKVLAAFRQVKKKGDCLLVIGQMSGVGDIGERLKFAYGRYMGSSTRFHLKTVDSEQIQVYVNAADVMVLGHTSGLNSGVAVLGMTFGKPVIGPDLGCISSVLDQGINLTYETENVQDLADKMLQVRDIDFAAVDLKNKAIAKSWHWEDIARPVLS